MSFYKYARLIAGAPLRLLFRIKRYGYGTFPKQGGIILCSNHRSNYDPVILGASLDRELKFMAKEELFRIPLFNSLIRTLGAFPVRRGKGDTEAIKKAAGILKDGEVLTMFAEGTRNKSGGMPRRFKSGAALCAYKSHACVVPAAIITKGPVRPLKRNTVVFGEPIAYDDLGFTDGSVENLRAVSARLHDEVAKLIEKYTGAIH